MTYEHFYVVTNVQNLSVVKCWHLACHELGYFVEGKPIHVSGWILLSGEVAKKLVRGIPTNIPGPSMCWPDPLYVVLYCIMLTYMYIWA